jgi:hypothetical protein
MRPHRPIVGAPGEEARRTAAVPSILAQTGVRQSRPMGKIDDIRCNRGPFGRGFGRARV